MAFNNLHNHSDYSIMDSINKPIEMIRRAKELGQTAIAISDHGTVTGLFDFDKLCRKEGIKPILGVEMYFANILSLKDRSLNRHICLYAKNIIGYRNILKLVTLGYQNMYYDPRIDFDILTQYSEGIIATTACMGGLLKNEDTAEENLLRLQSIFGDDLFVEIHTNTMPEQRLYNFRVINLAKKHNIKLIGAVDAHYTRKEDAEVHRAWKRLDKNKEYFTTDDYFIMSEAEVRESLSYLPYHIVDECVYHTEYLANKCDVKIPTGGNNYPKFNVADEYEAVCKACDWDKLSHISWEDMYEYEERFEYEMKVLKQLDYLNYFLINHDFLQYADEQGIRHGVGRGSISASLVAYLMGITGIDPIKNNLVFERFAHTERVTMADVDTDIQTSRRPEIIEYIKNKYGSVYNVRTVSKIGYKGAIQRAGQALGIKPAKIDKISSNISSAADIKDEKLRYLTEKFEGLVEKFSVHAAAVIIFPSDPNEWTAIEKQGNTFLVACSDYHEIEEQGILKLDLLGLGTLDVIDDTLKLIPDKIDINNLSEDDTKTFDMLCRGDTLGCFQIESSGMTDLVKKIQPRHFNDLVPLMALHRPGPMSAGMLDTFLERRRIHIENSTIKK